MYGGAFPFGSANEESPSSTCEQPVHAPLGEVWGQPVVPPCNFTRGELQAVLERSGFGSDRPQFDAYFRYDASHIPVCAHCGQPIAVHGTGPAATTIVVVADVQPRQEPPRGFAQDPANPSQWTSRSSSVISLVVGGILIVIATIMFIAFGVTGLLHETNGLCAIVPSMTYLMAALWIFTASWTILTIDLSTGSLHHRSGRLVCPGCCEAERTIAFADVAAVQSNVHTGQGRMPHWVISLRCRDDSLLFVGYASTAGDSEAVIAEWRGFLLAHVGHPTRVEHTETILASASDD